VSIKKTKIIKVPFSGNRHYPHVFAYEEGRREVDNYEFEDTLTYVEHERGGYATRFVMWGEKTETFYTFLVSDFAVIVPLMSYGKVHGRWTFVNRSGYIGCSLVKEKPIDI
jgi:hypothetical protein